MYIQPDTTLKLLEGIPLDKSYEHTVYYESKEAQFDAFNKYTKITLENLSYQRAGTGSIRVEVPYNKIYTCNYMLFKNTAFEDRWFYAFITGVTYISNDVTEVYYELDEMQTWCYDYDFNSCFIERQHSANDEIYENTQPEGLDLGSDYVYRASHSITLSSSSDSDKSFIILATTTQTGSKPVPHVENGALFSLYTVTVKGISKASAIIKDYIDNGLEQNIISIYTIPESSKQVQDMEFIRVGDLNGYKPKNKKLYCYPFTFLELYNNLGEDIALKFENFQNSNGTKINDLNYKFHFRSVTFNTPVPQAKCLTFNYLQTGASLLNNCVSYTQFPLGAFSGDTFKVWLAQNKNSYAASMNAIANSYDTTIQNSMLAYSQAERSNNLSYANLKSSINKQNDIATAAFNRKQEHYDESRKNSIIGKASSSIGSILASAGATAAGEIVSTSLYGLTANTQQEQMLTNLHASLNDTLATNKVISDNANLLRQNANKSAAENQSMIATAALTTAQNAVSSLVAKKQDAQMQPTNIRGALMNDSWNGAYNLVGFTIWERTIKAEYAKIIDDYFEKYGYAQRIMTKPTRLNRPHWSFLKTTGCSITGKMTASDLYTIQTIYNNGITTWDSLESVKNYSLDNSPNKEV